MASPFVIENTILCAFVVSAYKPMTNYRPVSGFVKDKFITPHPPFGHLPPASRGKAGILNISPTKGETNRLLPDDRTVRCELYVIGSAQLIHLVDHAVVVCAG